VTIFDHIQSFKVPGWLCFAALAGFLGLMGAPAGFPQTCASSTPPSVLTAQYGNLRQGYNSQESLLTSTCLSSGTVTLKQPVWSPLLVGSGPSGQTNRIQAQPLYVSAISTTPPLANCPNPCNMLLAVTLAGSVYAWNADTGATIWNDCQETGCTSNALWVEDCPGGGLSTVQHGGTAGLPFAGIVATPVIDTLTNPAQPVIYLTSLCETSTAHAMQKWWMHQLNLYTGLDQTPPQQIGSSADGPNHTGEDSAAAVSFNAWATLQRAALLEVGYSGSSTNPNPLIYAGFGFGFNTEVNAPYHGWIFAYDSSLHQRIGFVTTGKSWGAGSNTDQPSCTANCSCSGNACTPGPGCIASGYLFAANWCGHAGGVWMSGRGPAAGADSNGAYHAYFGVGNGGFQQQTQTGAMLPDIQNWGNSILDFRLGAQVFDVSPAEYFTPFGGPNVTLQQSLTTHAANPVKYTFEGLSQNDFDMATSGIMLFNDLAGNQRLLTIDKAGYGYLLTQANLCGSPAGCYPAVPAGGAGGTANDPGNAFSFAANVTQCSDQIGIVEGGDDSCHRVTSMAFYKDGNPPLLYLWPTYENLTALQLSGNSAQSPAPAGEITASGTAVAGSGTTFASTVIPGDTLIAGGCTVGSTCPVITAVGDDTHLTVSAAIHVTEAPWNYSGYFINPSYGTAGEAQYPGGSLTVTSDDGSGAVVWALVNLGTSSAGVLQAHDAQTLQLLFASNASAGFPSPSAFKNATFALPTVVNGYVYIATGGITSVSNSGARCSNSAPCSGILVYSGH
jgi:hypothetical protein